MAPTSCENCLKLEQENVRLKELNRIQRIVLDFDPFGENRELKSRLAQARADILKEAREALICDGDYPCWQDAVSGQSGLCWIHDALRALEEQEEHE